MSDFKECQRKKTIKFGDDFAKRSERSGQVQINSIFDAFLAENVKKGWNEVN